MPKYYKFIQILGKGTFGTVYLCHYKKNQKCVLKEIRMDQPCAKSSNQFEQLVKHEIYLLLHLNHPRIIQLFDYFCERNYVYIVMEYANNGTLTNFIDKRRENGNNYLTLNEILNIFCDILMGVEYMHIKHVIHRDLKTDNILMGRDGRIKIADFGISKVYSVREQETQNHNFGLPKLGTPYYMAPEAILRDEISFSMDIWALGCILYELAMFRHPFANAKDVDVLLNMTLHKFYERIPHKICDKNVLNELIGLMLEPEKARRISVRGIICHPDVTLRFYSNYYYHSPQPY